MLKFIYLFLFFNLSIQSHALANSDFDRLMNDYYRVLNTTYRGFPNFKAFKKTSKNSCTDSLIEKSCETSALGNKFDVSNISSLQLSYIMKDLKKTKVLPDYFALEGCFERNLKTSQYLSMSGLKTGTIIVYNKKGNIQYKPSSDITINWSYHVAPFVYDNFGNRLIIDLALSKFPLTEEQWKSFFTSNSSLSLKVGKSMGVFNSINYMLGPAYRYEFDWDDFTPTEKRRIFSIVNENLLLQKSYDQRYKRVLNKSN